MRPMSAKRSAWWEKQRIKGKRRVICEMASAWTLMMTIVFWVSGYLGPTHSISALVMVILLFGGGLWVGSLGWSDNERRYQKTLETNYEIFR